MAQRVSNQAVDFRILLNPQMQLMMTHSKVQPTVAWKQHPEE
jgi:hypothetical protein